MKESGAGACDIRLPPDRHTPPAVKKAAWEHAGRGRRRWTTRGWGQARGTRRTLSGTGRSAHEAGVLPTACGNPGYRFSKPAVKAAIGRFMKGYSKRRGLLAQSPPCLETGVGLPGTELFPIPQETRPTDFCRIQRASELLRRLSLFTSPHRKSSPVRVIRLTVCCSTSLASELLMNPSSFTSPI